MEKNLFVRGLICRECQKEYDKAPIHVCEFCFGPLEINYDYEAIGEEITREKISSRPWNMWRYRELLPIDNDPEVGFAVGGTPLIRAKRLEKILGVRRIWIKNDAVCYPTYSFKDRVVSVALSKALEFGFKEVACASTGNLGNSVAANAAAVGLKAHVFVPSNLEFEKIFFTQVFGAEVVGIKGNYDEVNRFCCELTNELPWAFANINLRPFYAEGSKTLAYEVFEELNWELPDHFVVPMAGGSLITKVAKAIGECKALAWVKDEKTRIHGAQASGCAPIVNAWKQQLSLIHPEIPNTIATSLAIGNPADGFYALNTIRNSEGSAESVSDKEIIEAMRLLAQEEGIFTETAGGVTLGVTQKLIEKGIIQKDSCVVVAITGNGLKTPEYLIKEKKFDLEIEPKVESYLSIIRESNDRFHPNSVR
jgi:threonine synthase